MPYKSQAQEKYFNANKKKLEKQGVNVSEWNKQVRVRNYPKRKNSIIKRKGNYVRNRNGFYKNQAYKRKKQRQLILM